MHCTEQPSFLSAARRGRQLVCAGMVLAALAIAGCDSVPLVGKKTEAQADKALGPQADIGTPARARNWDAFKVQAAKRMVAATPKASYTGTVPEVLLAIPVLETELNADGSIKRIKVLRYPSQARETTQMAIEAVKRAAPFGDVSHLPKPWVFTEAFLFNDDYHFKPRTLDN